MNNLSSWAISISICIIICAIVEMLVSDSKLEKTVRFVLGAFMLCAVIFPIGNIFSGISDINFDEQLTTDVEEKFNTQQTEMLKAEIVSLVNSTLAKKDIYSQKTEVNMDIDESSNISIITVTVLLEKKYIESKNNITDIIKSELGLDCVVVFDE